MFFKLKKKGCREVLESKINLLVYLCEIEYLGIPRRKNNYTKYLAIVDFYEIWESFTRGKYVIFVRKISSILQSFLFKLYRFKIRPNTKGLEINSTLKVTFQR